MLLVSSRRNEQRGRGRRRTFKYLRVSIRACMGRPFREALASTPVVLEIVPPGRRVSEKSVNAFVERVRDSVRSLENLNGVNIPEVLEENHAGQPFYRDLIRATSRRCWGTSGSTRS